MAHVVPLLVAFIRLLAKLHLVEVAVLVQELVQVKWIWMFLTTSSMAEIHKQNNRRKRKKSKDLRRRGRRGKDLKKNRKSSNDNKLLKKGKSGTEKKLKG